MERRKVTRRTEHTQAVKGLGQECKVEFWLVSYVSCIIFFTELNFSLIVKLGVLPCFSRMILITSCVTLS